MKSIFFLFILLFQTSLCAQKFTWFGTSNIVIHDDDTKIMFDPFITHPSFLDVFFHREVKSNKAEVKKWLKKANIESLDAVLVNHAHYDHALDLGTVLNTFPEAVGFGSQSSKNIALGSGIASERFKVVDDKSELKIKGYKLKTVLGKHPAHFVGITFMDGEIKEPFKLPGNPWVMNKGQDLMFHLDDGKGGIMFHAFANKTPYVENYNSLKARVLFIGVATRKSTIDQIEDIIKPINPQIIIPMHYDNFFYPLEENPSHFPTMNMDEWVSTLKKELPNLKVIMPKVGTWIELK